ncbi:hypothetical protein P9112_009122 [Eukaryota sp. TZLM1-RC]
MTRTSNYVTTDGNSAAAHSAYQCSDIFCIYPITPSTGGNELADNLSASGVKNIYDEVPEVHELQSEKGVVSALSGASNNGALTTTFTCSQGLLLMVPNIYKLAGASQPAVFHIASRQVFSFAGALNCDHSDVYACRQTGAAMLSSNSVQEASDLAFVSHYAAVKARHPFLHFYDGLRTSHEFHKIDQIEAEVIKEHFPINEANEFRSTVGLNNSKPTMSGYGCENGLWWQTTLAIESEKRAIPGIVEEAMDRVYSITGRRYQLFNYYGHPEAEQVIILMGSGASTVQEVIEYLAQKGEKVGMVSVHLFRPFSDQHILDAVPKTVKRICVLDKARENASADPLCLDVQNAFSRASDQGRRERPIIVGGSYGVCGFEFNPSHVFAVLNNLALGEPKHRFVVGPIDDLTHTSLAIPSNCPVTLPDCCTEAVFWSIGGDGTMGANRNACDIIGGNTEFYTQCYFDFSAKKTNGHVTSHLRFSPSPIKSTYQCTSASYVAVHKTSLVHSFPNILSPIKKGGVFVLNAPWTTAEELEQNLPEHYLKILAEREVKVFAIDALSVAEKVGLKNRVNNILQSVFFKLSAVLPIEQALSLLKDAVKKTYAGKGDDVVEMNIKAIDESLQYLVEIPIKNDWIQAGEFTPFKVEGAPLVFNDVLLPAIRRVGHEVTVSQVAGMTDGKLPTDTTRYERRRVGTKAPVWDSSTCISCHACVVACPHQAIRTFVVDEEQKKDLPNGFETVPLKGKGKGLSYRIQVAPNDCLSCTLCTTACPKDSLSMRPIDEVAAEEEKKWDYAIEHLANSDHGLGSNKNYKDLGFKFPHLFSSGACAGCTQPVLMAILGRMYGESIVLSQAVGCSMVWGNMAPVSPYQVNPRSGKGIALATSLFEDNAEYSYGMFIGIERRRKRLLEAATKYVADNQSEFAGLVQNWIDSFDSIEESRRLADPIVQQLSTMADDHQFVTLAKAEQDLFSKKVYLSALGDGAAMDIDLDGVLHVLASGANIKMLVYDTEVYSNTGGQASKATPKGAKGKFCMTGQNRSKMDLGQIVQTFGNVYVGSIASGYDMNHTIKTIREAIAFDGPALIIGLTPCIAWQTDLANANGLMKLAVETGFWPLYRYDPSRNSDGKNPLQIDYKKELKPLEQFLELQGRFTGLIRSDEAKAAKLHGQLEREVAARREKLMTMASM